ncbi:Thioredoxin domain-containing protein 5 [Camponotus japonicus]
MAINSTDFIASKRQLLFFLFILSQVSNGHDEDVFTLQYTSENFSTKIKTKNHFVMFYAPWCGHCQKLSSTWEQLAEMLNKENSNIRIAKVDCTTEITLCSEQDVTGYPTLKFYKTGETGSIKFRGTRNLPSLTAFIDEQLGSSSMNEDVAPSPPEAVNGLLELTKNTFEKHVSSGYHFVKFYAPWCGHCQKLAPTWDKLADSLHNDDAVSISKIDCTQHRSVCGQFDIKGYPTLLWIEDGKKIDKYTGERTHEELKAYVSMMLSKSADESNQKSENNNVPHAILSLTADSFQHGIEKGFSFVKFFAPWCGHCKRLAPTWEELGKKFFANNNVNIAKVDCTLDASKQLCNEQEVEGFPALYLYRDGRKVFEYNGSRNLDDLYDFVINHLQKPHDEL